MCIYTAKLIDIFEVNHTSKSLKLRLDYGKTVITQFFHGLPQ